MNPTRPLLFLATLVLAMAGWSWLPGPPWEVIEPTVETAARGGGLLLAFLGPGLPLLGLALLAASGVGGRGALAAGARFLVGVEREGELLAAHRCLAAAARAMVSGGLVIGLLGGTAAFLMVREVYSAGLAPNPANLARLIQWTMLAPLSALGIGRLILATAADAAAVRAGAPGRRTFGRRDDLLLLLYVLPAVMAFTVALWPARTIQ